MPGVLRPGMVSRHGGVGAPPPPPEFPSGVSGLWARYKANDETYADNDSATQMTDISGNARHATQGTAGNRATFKTAIVNGKSVYRFDGTNDRYAVPDASALTAATLFVVVKIVTDPPGTQAKSGLMDFQAVGTSSSHFPYIDGVIYEAALSNNRKTTGNPALSLSAAFRNYCVRSATNDWTSFINGTQHHNTATNTVGVPPLPQIGVSDNATDFLDGDIAEFILYSVALSTTDRQSVEAYLNYEYAL